jgi:hypothetical protein
MNYAGERSDPLISSRFGNSRRSSSSRELSISQHWRAVLLCTEINSSSYLGIIFSFGSRSPINAAQSGGDCGMTLAFPIFVPQSGVHMRPIERLYREFCERAARECEAEAKRYEDHLHLEDADYQFIVSLRERAHYLREQIRRMDAAYSSNRAS